MANHHAACTCGFICRGKEPAPRGVVAQQVKEVWRNASAKVINLIMPEPERDRVPGVCVNHFRSFAALSPFSGFTKQILFIVLSKTCVQGKVRQTVRLEKRQRFESCPNGGRKARNQDHAKNGDQDCAQAKTCGTRLFVQYPCDLFVVKSMERRIWERAPAVPGQFHGRMRIQPAGLCQEVKPVPYLAIPLLVPGGALRFGNQ